MVALGLHMEACLDCMPHEIDALAFLERAAPGYNEVGVRLLLVPVHPNLVVPGMRVHCGQAGTPEFLLTYRVP